MRASRGTATSERQRRGAGRGTRADPATGQLAAYRVLFEKRIGGAHDGEYVGLDFGHLRDLAAIDHILRYTLLSMTLDIEHFAKVKLMREVTDRADEDGYSIVADYLESLSERNRSIREKEMERLKRDRYSGGMARKYDEEKPVWILIELLSFGGFINFYLFYADRWKDRRMRSERYLLRQAQAVRNACAHSTDIINLTSRHFLSPLGAGPDRRQPREPAPSC